MSIRRSAPFITVGALVLVASLLLSGCAPAMEAAQVSGDETPARTITVVGRGEVTAKPDVASTSVGVEVTALTVEEALAEAEARMEVILKALKGLGIAEKDIQTSNFSINFERDQSSVVLPRATESASQPGAAEGPAGFYRVSNMLQVKIRDLDQVGAVLDAAVKSGANNIWGISFGLDETGNLEAEARENAVRDARSRAEALATLNGVSLGSVLAVSEVVGGGVGPIYVAEAAAKALGGGGASVEPGEVTFATQIQIVYSIR